MNRRKFSFGTLAALFTIPALASAKEKSDPVVISQGGDGPALISGTDVSVKGNDSKNRILMTDDETVIQHGDNKIIIDSEGIRFIINNQETVFVAPPTPIEAQDGGSIVITAGGGNPQDGILVYDSDYTLIK